MTKNRLYIEELHEHYTYIHIYVYISASIYIYIHIMYTYSDIGYLKSWPPSSQLQDSLPRGLQSGVATGGGPRVGANDGNHMPGHWEILGVLHTKNGDFGEKYGKSPMIS